MTEYQKIVTIIFRISGVIAMIAGSVLWIPATYFEFDVISAMMILRAASPYLLFGIILFALSKILASFVCFGLDKTDEK